MMDYSILFLLRISSILERVVMDSLNRYKKVVVKSCFCNIASDLAICVNYIKSK